MPVRYRKDTALKLLSDMNNFKSDILDTAKTALIDAKNIQEWNDKKYDVFYENLLSVMKNVSNSGHVIEDYQSHLQQKIRELEE